MQGVETDGHRMIATICAICGDAAARINRLLGERSPIIDVEHIYLYNRDTMRRIFSKRGFDVLNVFPVKNRYPLYYRRQMAPLPAVRKGRLVRYPRRSPLGRRTLSWQAGNLGLIARPPRTEKSP
jgi:hypothetical protein